MAVCSISRTRTEKMGTRTRRIFGYYILPEKNSQPICIWKIGRSSIRPQSTVSIHGKNMNEITELNLEAWNTVLA